MNNISFRKTSLRKAIIIAGLAAGLSIGTAQAAYDDDLSAAPQPHSDGIGAAISDTAITAKVKTALTGDVYKHSDISVTTTNGVVTLTGRASNSDVKSAAETAAKGVNGVRSIDNQLSTPSSSGTVGTAVNKTKRVASDSWITTKVKSDLLADRDTKSFDVSVTTIHGVVQLRGNLATQDAVDRVAAIAKTVTGVKSVDTSGLSVAGK